MRKRLTVLLLSVAWIAGGCAGPSGPKQSTASGYRASGESISVVEFNQEGAEIHYNAPNDAFGLAIAEEIASALTKNGHRADAVPARGEPKGQIIVSGRIVRID